MPIPNQLFGVGVSRKVKSMRRIGFVVWVVCCVSTVALAEAIQYVVSTNVPVDVYHVRKDVVVKDAKKIGINYASERYAHWKPVVHNLWNRFGAFEPRILVNWGRVEQGGENSFVCNVGWGLNGWNKWQSGFWDGAKVFVYRMNGSGDFELRRESVLVRSVAGVANPYEGTPDIIDTYTLEDDGQAAIQIGDWVYLKKILLKPNPNQLTKNLKTGVPFVKNGIDNFAHANNMLGDTVWELVMDPCPEAGSTASMKLSTEGAGGCFEYHTGGTQEGFDRWPEGSFRWEGWLKRDTPGSVRVRLGVDGEHMGRSEQGVVDHTFNVGTHWQKFEFEFVPSEAFAEYTNATSTYSLLVPDRCAFYLDNIMIYQMDRAPFSTDPEIIEKLKSFKPGIVRYKNTIASRSLDAALSKGISQAQEQDAFRGSFDTSINPLTVVDALEMSCEIESNPWIIIPPMMTMDDADHLMEYLAGPPESSFGQQRVSQGRQAPWVDAFERVYIELGNEQWRRSSANWFNTYPLVYARFAEAFIARMKASPYYDANKIRFVSSASPFETRGSLGERMVATAPSIDRLGQSFYLGGWERKCTEPEDVSSLYQARMLDAPNIMEPAFFGTLRLDSNLAQSLAASFKDDPDLLSRVVDYFPSNRNGSRGVDLSGNIDRIKALPLRNMSILVLEKSEAAEALLKKTLGVTGADSVDFEWDVFFNDEHAHLKRFIKQYPHVINRFVETRGLNAQAKRCVRDVQNGKKIHFVGAIYNPVFLAFNEVLGAEFKTSPEIKAAIQDSISSIPWLGFHGIKEKILLA